MSGWTSFWAAIIGGLITGISSVIAVLIAHKKDLKKLKIQEKRLTQSLLQSIHDEIEALWEAYQEGVGTHLEALSEGKPFLYYYPISQDYFTVYTTNSIFIGKIEDNDLRKLIITTYTQARGLIDSYRMNNYMLEKYEQWESLYKQTNNPVYCEYYKAYYEGLIKYAKNLKSQHNKVKKNVNSLLRKLRKRGVLAEGKEGRK